MRPLAVFSVSFLIVYLLSELGELKNEEGSNSHRSPASSASLPDHTSQSPASQSPGRVDHIQDNKDGVDSPGIVQQASHLPQLAGFLLQGVAVHAVELEGLDPDAERDLFLLLQLLLGLGHLPARVLHVAHALQIDGRISFV